MYHLGGHKITLAMAKQLEQRNVAAVPGLQLCRTCYNASLNDKKSTSESEDENPQSSSFIQVDEIEAQYQRNAARENLNETLKTANLTPIKTGNLNKKQRLPYVENKLKI